MSFPGLDSSVLLGYYQAQLSASPSALAAANARAAVLPQTNNGATANDVPPWQLPNKAAQARTAEVLSTTDYLSTKNVPLSAGASSDGQLEQDNQKLFSLYTAVNSLAYITKLAQAPDQTSGQLAGLNARFQTGMSQVMKYLSSTSFNNFTLEAAKPTASVTSTANIAFSNYTYATRKLVGNAAINDPVSGLSTSDSFTIAVKKAGVTTSLPINMGSVPGPLTLTNIVSYINSQLVAGGFSTRFQKTESGATLTSSANAQYGLQITPGANENVSFSATAKPALYLAGSTGTPSETNTSTAGKDGTNVTTTAADQAGRLTKLSGIDGSPTGVFSSNQTSTSGTTSAQNTLVDGQGNIYVLGTATGNMANQINQGAQDVYLTKYDSAGNVSWSNLLGSAGTASGYGMALDPSGGIVVTGATTADLVPGAVANGNNDSFVARYDSSGAQSWVRQIQTLAKNQANAVSVDASGTITIGGAVSGGVIGAGQVAQGGGDAYLAQFDSKGKLLAENQFGTSGADNVGALATGADGSLYVASVQNGQAMVAKYAGGDITSAPLWTKSLGALGGGGAIGGLTVSGNQIYLSGTSSNGALTAGGEASVAAPSTGGTDAFVFNLADNGASATANHVTYVGTAAGEQGGAVTVGSDGTVYLTGTTKGTFAGQQRSVADVNNAFATAIASDGTVSWTRQYGGADGQSTGAGIAVDPNGSSVLDVLGLPRGAVTLNQSVDLTTQTTLRAGDTFKIKLEGAYPRTATITIDKGETLSSLTTKINSQLGAAGKASVNYTGAAAGLKIVANPGSSFALVKGPADNDALGRLGIAAGTLSAPTKDGAPAANADATPSYGLGFSGTLDISTRTGANTARAQLRGVLSSLQSTYQTSNKADAPATVGQQGPAVTAFQTSQLANYSLALSLLGG